MRNLHLLARRQGQPSLVTTIVNLSSLGLTQGQSLTVGAGVRLVLDADTPGTGLGAVDIFGTVVDNNVSRTFAATSITIENGGVLQVGTENAPFPSGQTFNLTLNGAYVPLTQTTINGFVTPTNPGVSRGIMVMPGGKLDLHGTPPTTLVTTLNANAAAAATGLTLAVSPGWSNGDAVVVGTTDFVDYQGVEQFTLSGATSGTSATLSAGITASRYGILQYPTDVGLATSAGAFSSKKGSANVATVYDQRAKVANLNRNIIVSSPSDTDYTTKGHGVVIMAMASNGLNQALMRIEAIQVRRGGQRSAIGRYPIHWHMMSYNSSTGAYTSDSAGYVRKSAIWDSENRGITIHGTCGVEVSDNITYNVKGHSYFLEDGSERRNTVQRNFAFKTIVPLSGTAPSGSFSSISGDGTTTTVNWTGHGLYSGQVLTPSGWTGGTGNFNPFRVPVTVVSANQFTYPSTGNGTPTGGTFATDDRIKVHDLQAAGYWITNLDNTIQGNYAGGNPSGHGAWISIATQCFGLSAAVQVAPHRIKPLVLDSFYCIGNFGQGIRFNGAVVDEAGNTAGAIKYPQVPQNGDVSFGDPRASADGKFNSTNHQLFKNSSGAYQNATNIPNYTGWTVGDNGSGAEWQGSTNNGGTSSDHLGVGFSLNSATGGFTGSHDRELNNLDQDSAVYPRSVFTSYHGTVRFFNNTWINYPYHAVVYVTSSDKGKGGGMIEGGVDFYDDTGIDTTNGLNTNNQLINSHPGPMVSPIHLDGRGIDNNSGAQRHYSVASAWYDADGKYGTAGNFMIPFASGGVVDDYWLVGATSPTDGPVTGTAACKTTSTKYWGMGYTDTGQGYIAHSGSPTNGRLSNNYPGDCNPWTVTRQDPSLGSTIGTPFLIKRGDTSWGLNGYRTVSMQAGGRFKLELKEDNVGITMTIASPAVVTWPGNGGTGNHGLTAGRAVVFTSSGSLPTGVTPGTIYYVLATGLTGNTFQFSLTPGGSAVNTSGSQSGTHTGTFTIDPPNSIVAEDIFMPTGAVAKDDYVLLGLPWDKASTPRVCYGGSFSNEAVSDGNYSRNTYASAADVTNGVAIICSSGASLAAVLADTTGATFWQDTANNLVWVRFTNRKSDNSGPLSGFGILFSVTRYTIVVKV